MKEGKKCKCIAHITCPCCDNVLSVEVNEKDLNFNYDSEDRYWKIKCPECSEEILHDPKPYCGSGQSIEEWNRITYSELDEAAIIKRFAEKVGSHIAGHSDYHGDNILAALYAASEGQEIKDIKPIYDEKLKNRELIMEKERLEEIISNILDWGSIHSSEFRRDLIDAMKLNDGETFGLDDLEGYIEDGEY